MTERKLRTGLHRSVFVQLVVVMLATAAALLALVIFFFGYLINPTVSSLFGRLMAEHTRVLASQSPDLPAAREITRRLDVQIRYEGPAGTWQTTELPAIAEVRSWPGGGALAHFSWGRDYYVVPAPDGGDYLFAWSFRRHLRQAHRTMLWLLLLFVVGVVLAAYAVLQRLLRPLRSLHEGVTRLSEGHLDVALPNRTRDEFGVLTEAFNQMVDRIRDMLRARDQLLLDVSHELRSPLTRMKVALALLPEGGKKQSLANDVSEMEAMITELLELERLREGHGIRTRRQDLASLLREMVESFQDRPPGVHLAPLSEVVLEIDPDRIRTVLRNLLDNAIKYSLSDSKPVEISVIDQGETVMVRVTDDGPGIPATDLPQLFEPFFRVDRSRSKKTGGYGLGLSICKRVMEAHGGGIAVSNNPGRGATFQLTFRKV